MRARGGGAHHDLLVEAPEVLEPAAAAGDDEQVGARHRPAGADGVEAADGRGDLGRAALALHRDRPEQHAAREAVAQAVQDVADDGAGGRGDDADHLGQVGQRALAGGVEQALGGQRLLARLEHRHQRADAGGLDLLDDHWYFEEPGKVVIRPVATTSMPSSGWTARRRAAASR